MVINIMKRLCGRGEYQARIDAEGYALLALLTSGGRRVGVEWYSAAASTSIIYGFGGTRQRTIQRRRSCCVAALS